MIMKKAPDLSDALLMRGKKPVQSADHSGVAVLPVSEMAMVLTLDQLRPNPDNPRITRNPRYEDIKASTRARGLDSIPKVTRDPDGEDVFIFSDGGNTRYQILCELWQETGEQRFYRIHTIFKPWPGRLQCVIGHLAENEVRGDLSYIEKALGVHKARTLLEERMGRGVSLRELSELLNQEGYPIHFSGISRMEDTLSFIYPHMPALLKSGLSRTQVIPLLSLRSSAEKTWNFFSHEVTTKGTFGDVFAETCRAFDDIEKYSIEMFRDELIGELLKALSHPSLNYDRWLIELDPKEQQRRELYGDPPPPPQISAPTQAPDGPSSGTTGHEVTVLPSPQAAVGPITGLRAGTLTGPATKPEPTSDNNIASFVSALPTGRQILPEGDTNRPDARTETPPDLYGGPAVLSSNTGDTSGLNVFSALGESADKNTVPASSVAFAAVGLEPVNDIWHIPALQDDIEHLQDMAYRLAFELAEAMGCAESINEKKGSDTAGYTVIPGSTDAFVNLLNGMTGNLSSPSLNMFVFCLNFFGTPRETDTPVLDDVQVVKVMRLFRVLRRLRQLQRAAVQGGPDVN
jgi:ParB family protein of integrating conjugative element (PFGI_1 class)